MGLTKNQNRAVEINGISLFIQAGAGTGKTFTLTKRLRYGLSCDPEPVIGGVDRLLTITFTNKAAGELLGRVRAELREKGLNEEAMQVDAAWISTIHSMCQRILKSHAFEARLDPGAELLSEEETRALMQEAFQRVLAEKREDKDLSMLLEAFGVEDVNELVCKFVDKLQLVYGGVAELEFGPAQKGAASAQAAALLGLLDASKTEIEEVGVPDSTRASKNYAIVCEYADALGKLIASRGNELSLTELRDLLAANRQIDGRTCGKPYTEIFAECAGAIKEVGAAVAATVAREQAVAAVSVAEAVLGKHIELKRAHGAVDTNDLLIETLRLLDENPDIAAEYRERFDSIMVDEFQDTDQLQVDIIKHFTDEKLSTLATVGDAQQSIYGFRGADLEVYNEMRRTMEEVGCENVKLDTNFRSHPDVLAFVEDIFHTPEFFGGEFLKVGPGEGNARDLSWIGAGDPRVKVLLSAGEKGPRNASTNIEALRRADACAVVDELQALKEAGAEYGDMAILMKSTKALYSGAYLDELRGRGIPAVIAGGSDYFKNDEVHIVVALMRFLENCDDDEALTNVLASPMFDLNDDELLVLSARKRAMGPRADEARKHCSLYDALSYEAYKRGDDAPQGIALANRVLGLALDLVAREPLSSVIEMVVREGGWLASLERQGAQGQAIAANVQRMCDFVDDFQHLHGASVLRTAEHFHEMCELAEEGDVRGKPGVMVSDGKEAVQIMTIHASKGLEFPITVVAEYEGKGGGGGGAEVTMLTENGKRYLSMPVKAAGKAKTYLQSELEDPESFERASDAVQYAAHAHHLKKTRDNEEVQRLLYVALTRAREVLIMAVHDSKFASTGELAKAMNKPALEAVFGGSVPTANATVVTGCGAHVEFKITTVPYEPKGIVDEVMGFSEVEHLHPLPSERPHISAYLPKRTPVHSYSSIAHAGDEVAGTPVRAAIALASTKPETVSEVGSAFHLVAEWVAHVGGEVDANALRARIWAAARRYKLDADDIERLRVAINAWMASERFTQALSSAHVYPEHAFCVDVDGSALEGYIDLLCIDDEQREALIVDYKTGESGEPDELRTRYALQAACYAYAVLSAGMAQRVELAFIRPEVGMQEITYTYTQTDLDKLRGTILP